jgi:predicted dehydrogenase
MVRQARDMVRDGTIGTVRKVVVEYNQGWLATALERDGNKQAELAHRPGAQRHRRRSRRYRLACREPRRDRHGLEIETLVRRSQRPGARPQLDDDASVLLRFQGRRAWRARRIADQCRPRKRPAPACLRDIGHAGMAAGAPQPAGPLPLDGAKTVLTRGGPWLSASAQLASRIPAGHPEGFIEAFANIYRGVFADIRAGAGHASRSARGGLSARRGRRARRALHRAHGGFGPKRIKVDALVMHRPRTREAMPRCHRHP